MVRKQQDEFLNRKEEKPSGRRQRNLLSLITLLQELEKAIKDKNYLAQGAPTYVSVTFTVFYLIQY